MIHFYTLQLRKSWVSYFERQCRGLEPISASMSSQKVAWIIWHHYSSSKWIYCVEHSETDGGATTDNTINSHQPPPSAVANANIQMPSFPEILVHASSAHSRVMGTATKQTLPVATQSSTSPNQRRFRGTIHHHTTATNTWSKGGRCNHRLGYADGQWKTTPFTHCFSVWTAIGDINQWSRSITWYIYQPFCSINSVLWTQKGFCNIWM